MPAPVSDPIRVMVIKKKVNSSLIARKWDVCVSIKGKVRALRPTDAHFPTILVSQCISLREKAKEIVRDRVLLVLPPPLGGVGETPREDDTPRGGVSPRRSSRGRSIDPSKYKTKPCDNFARVTCTFGDRCTFKHNG